MATAKKSSKKSAKKPAKAKRFRSAESGKLVTKKFAESHKSTTVGETVKKK